MKEYLKALTTIQQASEKDTNGDHSREIQQQIIKCNEALSQQRENESEAETYQRAMSDPEIQVSR